MSQENLQTMIMQNFGGVKEVYYGIVQVVNEKNWLKKPSLSRGLLKSVKRENNLYKQYLSHPSS